MELEFAAITLAAGGKGACPSERRQACTPWIQNKKKIIKENDMWIIISVVATFTDHPHPCPPPSPAARRRPSFQVHFRGVFYIGVPLWRVNGQMLRLGSKTERIIGGRRGRGGEGRWRWRRRGGGCSSSFVKTEKCLLPCCFLSLLLLLLRQDRGGDGEGRRR